MRLRNALALGVTAATTGTAVLALAVGPSSAEHGPSQAAGSGSGSGSESGAGAGTSRSEDEAGSGSDAGSVLNPGSGLGTGPGVGLRADADSGFLLRKDSGAGSVVAEPDADAEADARAGTGTGAGTGSHLDDRTGIGTEAGTGPRPVAESGTGTTQRRQPSPCGEVTDPAFPIDTRIHRSPGVLVPGAGFRALEVDLTNTTAEACRGIHPVLVLTDRDRVLRPEQIRLEFYDSEARRWLPVAFEATEEDENVGAFSGFSGLTVPAGDTVTVSVRLAFREDTAPNEVVVNAAIVQRHGADGDWVGESDDVPLTIGPEGTEENPEANPESTPETNPEGTPRGNPRPVPDGTTPPESGDTGRPPVPLPPELAHTGPESIALIAPASGALLLTGASLVVASRRFRRRPDPRVS
ncbi:hypothetical protein ACFQ69_15785 [Streptomyces sp. NPDC056470]|uniref:hypothetical protein n=1 Tax=Streptomyces sp. NPDC056470 TaxID=3345831 RepID=UPI0036A3C2BA